MKPAIKLILKADTAILRSVNRNKSAGFFILDRREKRPILDGIDRAIACNTAELLEASNFENQRN